MDDWHAEMVVNGLADLASLLDDTDWLDTPTPSEYSLDLAKQKPLFVKALLIGMKHSDHDNVQDAIRMLEDYWHVRWPELDIINNSMRAGGKLTEDYDLDRVYDAIDDAMQEMVSNLGEPAAAYWAHEVYSMLDRYGGEEPRLKDYGIDLVRDKDQIMRSILGSIKHGSGDNGVIFMWLLQQYYHVKWPEFDILENSWRASHGGNRRLPESAPSYDEEAYRYAEEMAENLPDVASNPSEAMHLFMHLADNPEVVGTDYAEYFQPHKTSWIRFLLTAMKGDEWTEDEIYTAVDILQRMNLGWDELDTIQRSIGADFRG
jgi:hypothetical protein